MKKVLAILAIALFLGGITVPAVASVNSVQTMFVLGDDDPATETKTEKKSESAKKSGECPVPAKSETAKSETAKSEGECTTKKTEDES